MCLGVLLFNQFLQIGQEQADGGDDFKKKDLWDPISEIPSGFLPCDKSREKEECSCQKMTGNVRCGDMRHIRGLILTENCLLIAHSSEN